MIKIVEEILNLIYPTRCPACDDILEPNRIKKGFCKCCAERISYVGKYRNICVVCGKHLEKDEEECCKDCQKLNHHFVQGKAIYEYTGSMKEAMYRFKYGNKRDYSRAFAKDAIRYYGRWIKSIEPSLIVPVPMFQKKEKQRGYNQAKVFADKLSKMTGIPVDDKTVLRRKNTQPLKQYGAKDRRKILRGAFVGNKEYLSSPTVLLVDDIYTSGATIDAVTETLLEVGAGKVYAMSICIGCDK